MRNVPVAKWERPETRLLFLNSKNTLSPTNYHRLHQKIIIFHRGFRPFFRSSIFFIQHARGLKSEAREFLSQDPLDEDTLSHSKKIGKLFGHENHTSALLENKGSYKITTLAIPFTESRLIKKNFALASIYRNTTPGSHGSRITNNRDYRH